VRGARDVLDDVRVVVHEELQGGRDDNEPAEDDADQKEGRDQQEHRLDRLLRILRERRDDVRVELIAQDRQADQEAGIDRDGDRVEERLTWRERDQLVVLPEVLRQRRQEEVIDPVVLEVAGRDRHHEHRDRDDQPRAQLVQMLDEGELVVRPCALDPRHQAALLNANAPRRAPPMPDARRIPIVKSTSSLARRMTSLSRVTSWREASGTTTAQPATIPRTASRGTASSIGPSCPVAGSWPRGSAVISQW